MRILKDFKMPNLKFPKFKMNDIGNIQDLDLTKIPSLRRNTIISDLFGRLHFMDRRGSGITRIIESYSDCDIKPRFSSGVSNFTVIFPNKRYVKENAKNPKRTQPHIIA